MENAPLNNSENNQNTAVKPKITFMNRYFHLSEPHNRVSRGTFLLNCILFGIITIIIEKTIPSVSNIFSIVFLVLYIVQITKRLHDFGRSGHWTFGIILYDIIILIAPIAYIMLAENVNYLLAILTWELTLIASPFMLIGYYLASLLPIVILSIIPGDKEVNKYGNPQIN